MTNLPDLHPKYKTCDHCEEAFRDGEVVATVTCHQTQTVRRLCEKCFKEADDYNKAQQALN